MILKRLAKIENARAVHERQFGRVNPAELLRERRKRRLLAEGLPYTDPDPIARFNADGSLRTISEILRLCRQRRLNSYSQT